MEGRGGFYSVGGGLAGWVLAARWWGLVGCMGWGGVGCGAVMVNHSRRWIVGLGGSGSVRGCMVVFGVTGIERGGGS